MNEAWLWAWRILLLLFLMSVDGHLQMIIRMENDQ